MAFELMQDPVCSAAFKEWASVIRAMEVGAQTLLLRKGGISEDNGLFRIDRRQFLLFPTFEHQETRLLQPAWTSLVPETIRSQDSRGRIAITSFATVEGVFVAPGIASVQPLKDLYIWNDRYVEGRFKFQPQQPLYILLLRVYRLPEAALVDFRSEYGGCRSWVELDTAISLEGAVPAIEESRFASIYHDINGRLGRAGIQPEAPLPASAISLPIGQ